MGMLNKLPILYQLNRERFWIIELSLVPKKEPSNITQIKALANHIVVRKFTNFVLISSPTYMAPRQD